MENKKEKGSSLDEDNPSIFVKTLDAGEERMLNASLESLGASPIGLKLDKMKVLEELQNAKRAKHSTSQPDEKLKTVCFQATLLKIGEFHFVPSYEGELVVKCCFAKRKFVWEMLDKSISIKHKVQVPWQNILAMRAVLKDNSPGILEIELEKEPQLSEYLPGGHVLTYRRHYLEFVHGVFDKHYEKLLQSDSHLCELSKQSYPSLASPYFDFNDGSAGNSKVVSETNPTSTQQCAPSSSSNKGDTAPSQPVPEPPLRLPDLNQPPD